MPVYLLHGFRWPRPLIRIHIILQNLDDAAAEWLVAPGTTSALLQNFQDIYPEVMEHLQHLRFIEQYDPNDTSPSASSQPHAYVADMVHEVRLGVDVEEVRGKGVTNEQWGCMLELRDKLAPDAKVGWFVVVCGDEERWAPSTVSLLRDGGHSSVLSHRESDTGSNGSASDDTPRLAAAQPAPARQAVRPAATRPTAPTAESPSRGLRKLFSRSLSKRRR